MTILSARAKILWRLHVRIGEDGWMMRLWLLCRYGEEDVKFQESMPINMYSVYGSVSASRTNKPGVTVWFSEERVHQP